MDLRHIRSACPECGRHNELKAGFCWACHARLAPAPGGNRPATDSGTKGNIPAWMDDYRTVAFPLAGLLLLALASAGLILAGDGRIRARLEREGIRTEAWIVQIRRTPLTRGTIPGSFYAEVLFETEDGTIEEAEVGLTDAQVEDLRSRHATLDGAPVEIIYPAGEPTDAVSTLAFEGYPRLIVAGRRMLWLAALGFALWLFKLLGYIRSARSASQARPQTLSTASGMGSDGVGRRR